MSIRHAFGDGLIRCERRSRVVRDARLGDNYHEIGGPRLHIHVQVSLVLATTSIPRIGAARAEGSSDTPIMARVESTLFAAPGKIRQFAFDGDQDSLFASVRRPGPEDHFTLVFDRPTQVRSIRVLTGRSDGQDRLDAGYLEGSDEGMVFERLADFDKGLARLDSAGRKLQAIRVRPAGEMQHPLAIREIILQSDPPIATFDYPVEITVDVADAPEMRDWAQRVARICERAYPMINQELTSPGFTPPREITMRLRKDYNGVAATSGTRITGSAKYFGDHPDDVGALVHETVHVVQRYRTRNNPGWLVEGVAD